jgi:hypothetical protein
VEAEFLFEVALQSTPVQQRPATEANDAEPLPIHAVKPFA